MRAIYLRAALRRPWGILLLAAGGLTALAEQSGIPLVVAASLQLGLAGLVAQSPRFRRRVDRRIAGRRRRERARRDAGLLGRLPEAEREHFLGLRLLADRIGENLRRLGLAEPLLSRSDARIETLLDSFLRLLVALDDHHRFFSGDERQILEREYRELQLELGMARASRPAVAEIMERRLAILGRRLERFERAEESREVIRQQLASIEDLLRLLHDQSITLQSPDRLTRQLDVLAIEAEEAENTIRELDRILALSIEAGLPAGAERG